MVSNYNSFFLGLSSNTKMQVKMSKIIVLSGGAKSKVKPIKKNGYYYFKDYPEFTPNISPEEMFRYGSFGGTYWRPIKSKFFKGELKNKHLKYPKSWWDKIPDNHMTLPFNKYDETVNKYGVKVGSTLEDWEKKDWIVKIHPYGWVQWYCDFFIGERGPDDERQIKRWQEIAGENGRFRKFLITIIQNSKGKWNDHNISKKIRQTLLHWGYELNKKDYDSEIEERKKKKK